MEQTDTVFGLIRGAGARRQRSNLRKCLLGLKRFFFETGETQAGGIRPEDIHRPHGFRAASGVRQNEAARNLEVEYALDRKFVYVWQWNLRQYSGRFSATTLSDQGARQNGRGLKLTALTSGGRKSAERQARVSCCVGKMAFRKTEMRKCQIDFRRHHTGRQFIGKSPAFFKAFSSGGQIALLELGIPKLQQCPAEQHGIVHLAENTERVLIPVERLRALALQNQQLRPSSVAQTNTLSVANLLRTLEGLRD